MKGSGASCSATSRASSKSSRRCRVSGRASERLLYALGAGEVALAAWAFSGVAPIACAAAQTLLLVALNANGLIWARRIIHDPGGMVVKNFTFLVLAWVAAGLPGWP